MRWPVREALIAFRHELRERANEDYQRERLLYALGGLKKKPELPAILKG